MRSLDPPGRLIDIGGRRLHLHCMGSGSPTVVLDAALGASSISWALVQPEVAAFTQVCSYDRAGFGWSDAGPLPRTAGRVADELHVLLQRTGLHPPFVLVGHSFGGLVVRIFTQRHRDEVGGLVLVDPADPAGWIQPSEVNQVKIARGTRLCRYGGRAARLGLARLVAALAASGRIQAARKLVRGISGGGLAPADEDILAPMWKLPSEVRQPLWRFWTEPKFFEALGSQIESICLSAVEAQTADREGYADLPLVTISASTSSDTWRQRQDALASLSSRGRHIVASNSGHWVPIDEPKTVVSAIAQVVSMARQGH